MNPLTNRWAALLAVAAILFAVSELADKGGVLSQYADNESMPAAAQAEVAVATEPVPTIIEDEPQRVWDEDVDEDDAATLEDDASADDEESADESESFESEPEEEPDTSFVSSEPEESGDE